MSKGFWRGCSGTCGISHRWSSSRDDCRRSSSSNNSDIEDLRQVIVPSSAPSYVPMVRAMVRGLTSNRTMIILTCWTTGRRQPWRSHIWQVHPPSISPPDLLIRQPETGRISLKAVHPCLRLQIARAEGNLTAIRTLLLLLLLLWAHQLVPVSLFPPEDGCDMQQPLIVRPALT